MGRTRQMSPESPAARGRITGVVYLLFFLTAIAGSLLPPGIGGSNAMPSDAAALANSILANKQSYELAVSLGLVSTTFYVALARRWQAMEAAAA